jgi:hypothetical protein
MKAIEKKVYDKKLGKVTVYELTNVPNQLRSGDISWYQKVILGNSDAFEYLKRVFIIASSMKNKKTIIYIKEKSEINRRFDEWLKGGMLHMDIVISNYNSFVAKPKHIKRIIDISKKVIGQEMELNDKDVELKDIPYWKIKNTQHVKSYGKYIMISSNELGYLDLAKDANRLVGLDNKETYMCDFHIHLDENTETDFWYYYESYNG